MASPATTAFLAAWRNYTARKGHCLVKVALTSPSTYTLRLAGTELATPDGLYELALSDIGPVVAEGDFLTHDISLCTFSFVLMDRRLSGQTSGTSLSLLASYVWYGATVTAYLWEESLTSFSDALQIFQGQVIDCAVDGLKATIRCRQSSTALLELPTGVVTDPRAPQESKGKPRGGILYGSHLSPPARAPASAYGQFQQGLTSCYGGQRAVIGTKVLVGRGNGGEKGRVLFAHHACRTFNSDVAGATPYIDVAGRLCEIDPLAGDVLNSAADGTGFNVADISAAGVYPFDVFVPILATEVSLVAANNGESPRSALDTVSDFNYAKLDYSANFREITYRLASIPSPGRPVTYYMVIGYHTSAGAANCLVEFGKDGGVPAPDVYGLAASTTPTVASCAVVTGGLLPASPYDLTSNFIRFYFNGVSAGEKFYIHYVGLVVKTIPNGDVVTPGRPFWGPEEREASRRRKFGRMGGGVPWINPQHGPDILEYSPPQAFFATLEGYADDGGGTYTGTAGALIELAPDVLRHLLITYCNQVGGDITTAGSTFGSLVDLRSNLVSWRGSNMRLAAAITSFRQSTDIIRDMAQGALSWIYLSRFDSKWKMVPWKAGLAVDYDYTLALDRRDVVDPEGPQVRQGIDQVENNIEIAYSWDDWQRRFLFSTFVGPNRSQAGHLYRNLRDGRIEVVANQSDRLDFTDSGGAHTANLTAAVYATGGALASHAQTQMRAVDGVGVTTFAAYGYEIVAGVNDKLDFLADPGAAVKLATLNAGTYATGALLATEVARAMNVASSGWSCTYSTTTRLFTITRTGAGAGDVIDFTVAAPNHAQSVLFLMGFSHAALDAAPATSTYETEPEKFYLGASGSTVAFNWETGANGINAATPRYAAILFGHDPVRDKETASFHQPDSPVCVLEHTMTTSAARYGKRRLLKIELPYVNDTDTAREIRKRLADLLAAPRPPIAFRSERIPDLERGRVLQFSSDFDSLKPYTGIGSDGSWGGKKFMATRVIQNCGPVFETEVEATEISAA